MSLPDVFQLDGAGKHEGFDPESIKVDIYVQLYLPNTEDWGLGLPDDPTPSDN